MLHHEKSGRGRNILRPRSFSNFLKRKIEFYGDYVDTSVDLSDFVAHYLQFYRFATLL